MMREGAIEAGHGDPTGPRAYSLLQQQLVSVRARLDRQVSQLIRLNRISDELLRSDRPAAAAFAEAIVDVLDVALAAVWVFPSEPAPLDVAVFGLPTGSERWRRAGRVIADGLVVDGVRRAVNLDRRWAPLLPGVVLLDPIVCPCIGSDDQPNALIVAANTDRMAGMFEPTAEETLEIFTLVGEKLAAHCEAAADRLLIQQQMRLVQESEQRLSLVLKGTNDGWWDWDLAGDSCFVSERWLQMLGRHGINGAVLAGFWSDRIHDDDRPDFDRRLTAALRGEELALEAEVRLRHEDGTDLPVLVRGTVTRGPAGEPLRFTGSILDLTERYRQEQQVRRLAFYDPLTDLPNRRLLLRRLDETLARNADTGEVSAVLMLDLDRFKILNDTHGHAAGDQLLRAAALRLQSAIRDVDVVARLSGDEFIVLVRDAGRDAGSARATAVRVAERIQRALGVPFELEAGTIHHSASIGVALAAGDATVETVMQHADVAMYAAKAAGRNGVRVFEQHMQTRLEEEARFEARMRTAFDSDEFTLHYQPQVDGNGDLRGLEALLRWIPRHGDAVATDRVVAAAEESGLIHEVGLWVLTTACRQAALWRLGPGSRMAVNLSAAEFLHPDFPQRVLAVLDATGVPGAAIRLEITEATVVSDLEFAASRMELLRSHGIEFALDDFGVGYSSLTYLRRLPLSEVKIDKSFVAHLPDDTTDAAIVDAVVTLCTALGLQVVAEGVETREQLAALQRLGCDRFQGYLLGPPAPPTPQAADLVIAAGGPR